MVLWKKYNLLEYDSKIFFEVLPVPNGTFGNKRSISHLNVTSELTEPIFLL